MKRQTRRNRYEKHRPIRLPKERPVQPRNKSTNMGEWFAEWYDNHRTPEQLVEMHNWLFRFRFQMSPEEASQFRRDAIEYCSSPNTNNEKRVYWDEAFISSLSDEEQSTVLAWFHQWFNDNQPNSSVDV